MIVRILIRSAAVARLTLSGIYKITDTIQTGPFTWDYDKDLSGLISLCDAFLALKNPLHLDLVNCGLGVNGVNPLAEGHLRVSETG